MGAPPVSALEPGAALAEGALRWGCLAEGDDVAVIAQVS